MPDIIYTDVRALFKQLDQIEPGLTKELKREAKKLALDVADPVKRAIPSGAPMSGMNRPGRLSYNASGKSRNIKPRDVRPSFTVKRSRKVAVTSLVKVIVKSPAVAMLDMARVGRTPSGRQMIRNLRGSASRYVWPAAEKALPKVIADTRQVLEKAAAKLGRKLF